MFAGSARVFFAIAIPNPFLKSENREVVAVGKNGIDTAYIFRKGVQPFEGLSSLDKLAGGCVVGGFGCEGVSVHNKKERRASLYKGKSKEQKSLRKFYFVLDLSFLLTAGKKS